MRELFLLDPDITFLNHGSFGAVPREVFDDWVRWQLLMERNPVEFLGRRSATLLHASRQRLAVYMGADADDLVLMPNATTAVNVVARGLRLQPGDEVLATDHEYGACDAAWRHLCAAAGATYRQVEIPLPFVRGDFVQRMLDAVGPRTRLVFASHLTSTTALIFPVAALCQVLRERGIVSLIDGAHAPGQIDLDLPAIGADFYAGNCHKWMCAPKGSGFVYARREHHASLDAPVLSWGYVPGIGAIDGAAAMLGSTPLQQRMQWQGTRDIASALAVAAAIDFQARHDWPAVRQRCHALACGALQHVVLRSGLAAIGQEDDHAQMVPLPVPPQQAEALRRRLYDVHRIEVPVTQHAGRTFVRMSVQGYNDAGDVAHLLAALS